MVRRDCRCRKPKTRLVFRAERTSAILPHSLRALKSPRTLPGLPFTDRITGMARPEDTRSDEELVDAGNLGDPRAMETLYRRYRAWVFALALRTCGNEHDAADDQQEICFECRLQSSFKSIDKSIG